MIHKAWTFAYGNSDELVATADLLDKIDGTLVQTYADRTKQDPKTIEGGWPPKRGLPRTRRWPMVSPTALPGTRPRRKRRGTSAPTASALRGRAVRQQIRDRRCGSSAAPPRRRCTDCLSAPAQSRSRPPGGFFVPTERTARCTASKPCGAYRRPRPGSSLPRGRTTTSGPRPAVAVRRRHGGDRGSEGAAQARRRLSRARSRAGRERQAGRRRGAARRGAKAGDRLAELYNKFLRQGEKSITAEEWARDPGHDVDDDSRRRRLHRPA